MDKQKKLDEIREKMDEDLTLPLRTETSMLVFGEGNPDANILMVGEGPGYWEDQKGVPFVGRAGTFLNSLLESISLDRKDVFITNIVHFRPPENRDPTPEEIGSFRPYLDEIINIIEPKIIVTLGRFSMAKFLPSVMISKVHGKEYPISWVGREMIIAPMYHPAAGLRNSNIRNQTFIDFEIIPMIIQKLEEKEKKKPIYVEQLGLALGRK